MLKRGMYFLADSGQGGGTGDTGNPPAGADSGNSGSNWRTMMPGEFREHESFKPYPTAKDMFKAHVDMDTELKGYRANKDRIVIKPADDAKPEEFEAFAKAIGRPDKPEGYELDKIKLPEGMELDKPLHDWFVQTAHKSGLPKSAAQKMYNEYNQFADAQYKASLEARTKAREEAKAHLSKEWGEKAPENLEKVKRLVTKFAGEQGLKELAELGVGDHPGFLKFLLAVGEPHFNDKAFEGGKGSSGSNANIDKFGRTLISGIPVFDKHLAGAKK